MTNVNLTSKDPADLKVDALIVPVAKGPIVPGARDLPKGLRRLFGSDLSALGITGEADEVRRLPSLGAVTAPVVVTTGIGALPADGPTPETLRRAAGAAVRELAGTEHVALAFGAVDAAGTAALAEGAALGAYTFAVYHETKAPVTTVEVVTPLARDKRSAAARDRAQILGAAVAGVRDLVNTSPSELYPETFADRARAEAKGTGVKVAVLDDKALREGGYGGLTAVGQGSVRPPRLVRLTWAPSRARKHVALVGKGITFDSGGLSIKPAKGMEAMKSDMAGAATVMHAVLAAARLELPIKVTGWMALAENMPSGSAQRPSDVITILGGTTVEVLNTDAEGRLVLADALSAAVATKPDAVIDIATLTGAQMVALGPLVGGAMGTEETRGAVVAAAGEAGEQFWPMPLPEELREGLKSKVADIANIGERWGGMLSAGLFLREFVGDTPWAHLDVAGPAFNEGTAHGYTPAGGTGMGLRTLVRFLETVAAG